MADKTKIEWADATLNYVNGCSLHSPGCTNCYAMKQAHRFPVRQGLTVQSKGGMVWTGEVRENPKALEQAMRWKKPRSIFWNAHGDLFHESAPNEWIDRQFAAMALTPQHRHLILTKRADRMRKYTRSPKTAQRVADQMRALGKPDVMVWPIPNVWMGVSAENQEWANIRIPELLATPAAHRFVSCEPLLGPINLYDAMWAGKNWRENLFAGIDWIIVGAESGHKARYMDIECARGIRNQCVDNGTAFFMKQLSGEKGRANKEISSFPDDLRIRDIPLWS